MSNLTESEVRTVCEIISGRSIKKLFETNPMEFAKIKRGFRASSLSDKAAIDLAVKYRNELFISDYLNTILFGWVNEIREIGESIEAEVKDYDISIASTLVDSVFSENIELYFKLIEKKVTEEYLKNIRKLMDDCIASKYATKTFPKTVGSAKLPEGSGSTEELRSQLTAAAEEIEILKEKLSTTTYQLNEVNAELSVAMEQKHKMKTAMDELNARIQYDDSEEFRSVEYSGFNYVSICEVSETDYTGQRWLNRLADIGRNGSFEVFCFNEGLHPYFGNRSKLFFRDGPDEPGTVGVWNWSATPNRSDSSRDYVVASFNEKAVPVEVITIKGCENIKDVISSLRNGVEAFSSAKRIMFSTYITKGQYIGVLCNNKEFEITDHCLKLSDNVITLPQYSFSIKDTVRLSNDRVYFRKLSVGIPTEIVAIKDRLEIVKSIILSRNSWQTFKQAGGTRSEWRVIRDFLEHMDTSDLIRDIEEATICSHSEAESLLQQFVDNASLYIEGESVEDEVLSSVIAVNDDLMTRCKELLRETWEEENKVELHEAQERLTDLQTKLADAKRALEKQLRDNQKIVDQKLADADAQLKTVNDTHAQLNAELDTLSEQIVAKKKLASDVEKEVSDRIKKAQGDAAEFIATMAFISPVSSQLVDAKSEVIDITDASNANPKKTGYVGGEQLSQDDAEDIGDWKTALDVLAEELLEAGVAAKLCRPLAAYMYSAYERRMPILFVGPNSSEIVDAFSVSLYGKTAGSLECTENYDAQLVDTCISSDDRIVRISNAFCGNWINRIPGIIKKSDPYFYVVHPFAEDIQIEPKSLFAYMLPVFTEVLLDKAPTGNMLGGIMSEGFKKYASSKVNKTHMRLLSDLRVSPLVANNIQSVLSDMHGMLNDTSADWDALFALLPYAYATMQTSTFFDAINNSDKNKLQLSNGVKTLLISLYGEKE
jgi:predicted nuclease with TOPRIM domain